MATDFFERQAAARRTTKWLVVVFFLAMFAIVAVVTAATAALLQVTDATHHLQDVGAHPQAQPADPWLFALMAGAATFFLVGGGSLFKIAQLSGGGTTVAESLGGHRVPQNTTDPIERRLVNVVEEMALASGVPVPPIYILKEEQGINAFAAGFSPSDAVVAVTQGTAEQLTREELQGVVAHEFSHVLHGDMRLNIRLIGILHGILLLGLIGRMLFYVAARGGGNRNSKGGGGIIALLLLGLALIIIGSLGTLIGSIIKAAVSRQREYLADSSAVQFTRNPSGIAGALKRIGAAVLGSRLTHPNAAQLSHMYFGQGVWEGFSGLMATHPPLGKRIRALEPQWDGKYPAASKTGAAFRELGTTAGFVGGGSSLTNEVPVEVVRHSAEQVGCPLEMHRSYSEKLIASIPPQILENVHEPYSARAVMFALLLDNDTKIREQQFASLSNTVSTDVVTLTRKLAPVVDLLDSRVRLPLVDLTLPALRTMTRTQFVEFSRAFQKLVEADQRIALFEWTLHSVLLRHLRPQFEGTTPTRIQYYSLKKLNGECGVLLSTLAYLDHSGPEIKLAHQAAAAMFPDVNIPLLDARECSLGELQQALSTLATASPKLRERLVEASAVVICYDHDVTVKEGELFRGICDLLDCPMPPLLPGQPIAGMFDKGSMTADVSGR